jgi:hypothetical protein
MNEIRYNQASTFGQVLIAGMFATQLLPAISQRNVEESSAKNVSRAIYRTTSNAATYSHFGSPITGGYPHAIEKLEYSWITPELADFLHHSSQVSLKALDYLLVAIRDTYGNVQIDAALHTDPEEGWVKPVITVHSGMEDFDKLLDVEDSFFAKAANDPTLLAILPFVVVSQA